MLFRITFRLEYGADLLARVFHVPFVEHILERRQVVFRLHVAVNAVVHGNKSHVAVSEIDLRVITEYIFVIFIKNF